jgi:hypothetical protein
LWITQDASGYQYVWTTSGWVDVNSAEGQSVLSNPSNYAAGALAESGGYWYSQDANGNLYLWTTSGWVPTTATAQTDPSATVAGPPVGGGSPDELNSAVYETGDPAAIDLFQQAQEAQEGMIDPSLAPSDVDQDNVTDGSDVRPYDPDFQDAGDVLTPEPSDPEYYESP